MKRNVWLITLLILTIFPAGEILAQNPKKLEKLRQKGKYEKMISLTDKKIKNRKATESTWYYNIQGNLMKARDAEGKHQEKSYYDATRSYKRLDRVKNGDSIQALLQPEMQELGKIVFEQVPEKRKKKRKYYAGFFAEYYGDTLDVYYTYYPRYCTPEVAEYEEDVDTAPVETVDKLVAEIKYSIPAKIPARNKIIKKAEEVLETPWIWAGMTPKKGFDCSGFVIWTYGEFGYEFPHSTKMLATIGTPVTLDKAEAGDLVCFGSKAYKPKNVYHVGLVHSRDKEEVKLIHCGTTKGVSIVSLTSGYWSDRDYFIVRIAE